MRAITISQIDEADYKAIKPMLDRLGVKYQQHTIKEVDDPESLKLLKECEGDTMLSVSDTKKALKELGIHV